MLVRTGFRQGSTAQDREPSLFGLPSNTGNNKCRVGCPREESASHILQSCPLTNDLRIKRHHEIANKIASAARKKGLAVDVKPYVRHPDGRLYKPDMAIHQPDSRLTICDIQVSRKSPRKISATWLTRNWSTTNRIFTNLPRRSGSPFRPSPISQLLRELGVSGYAQTRRHCRPSNCRQLSPIQLYTLL